LSISSFERVSIWNPRHKVNFTMLAEYFVYRYHICSVFDSVIVNQNLCNNKILKISIWIWQPFGRCRSLAGVWCEHCVTCCDLVAHRYHWSHSITSAMAMSTCCSSESPPLRHYWLLYSWAEMQIVMNFFGSQSQGRRWGQVSNQHLERCCSLNLQGGIKGCCKCKAKYVAVRQWTCLPFKWHLNFISFREHRHSKISQD